MGFTLQLILGLFLILQSCNPKANARSVRNSTEEDVSIITEKAVQDLDFGKKLSNNVNKENPPKTNVLINTINITDNNEKKLTVNHLENVPNNLTIVKLEKSESYRKIEPSLATTPKVPIENVIQKQQTIEATTENFSQQVDKKEIGPEEKARSIDVDISKYVSSEFHNINNVYTVPVSADTEKYIDQEPANSKPKSSLSKHYLNDDTFDPTTSMSDLFDKKYRETVHSVQQQLEHLDVVDVPETKEDASFDDTLLDKSDKKNATTNLDFVKIKNLISNSNKNKTSKHKDLTLEEATKINFESTYGDTVIQRPDDKQNKITQDSTRDSDDGLLNVETTSVRNPTSRKPVALTKPPHNRNISHILNNRIEVDMLKKSNLPNLLTSTTEAVQRSTIANSRSSTQLSIDITKRGSVKYADYTTTIPSTTKLYGTTIRNKNKFDKTLEQVVQENQVIPIHVTVGIEDDQTVTDSTPMEVRIKSDDKTTTIAITTTTTTQADDITDGTTKEPQITTIKDDIVDLLVDTTTLEPMTTTIRELPTTTVENFEETTVFTTTENPSTTEQTTTENLQTTTDISIPEDGDKITTEVPDVTTVYIVDDVTTEFTTEANRLFKPSTSSEKIPILLVETTTEFSLPDTTTLVNEINKNFVTTKQVVIYHIQNIDNHTTLLPEIINPEYNYPTPVAVDNDATSTANSTIAAADDTSTEAAHEEPDDNKGTIAAIVISSVGAVCLVLLAGLLYIMRKRQKRFNYGERCTPVSLDDYSMDNVSVYNSVRRKGAARASKRSYGNPAFDDPVAATHPLNFPALAKFASNLDDIRAEFEEIPQISARISELPEGCETKNRYANVIPLPETRVFLHSIEGYQNSDYINANYVTGPKNVKGYYIACQGPMQNTVDDFWRMIWEQQSKVILMITQLFENGIEKCVDYLPPSEVLDCHRLFGDFQVTLKKREVKDKYIISSLQLKNMVSNSWREVTHFWYLGWPDKGVPKEPNSIIAFLIEARSHMKSATMDHKNGINGVTNGPSHIDVNPVVIHCSPGTGRTGVVIACDIAIREFEKTRLVDIPRIVYRIRRDRASSVQTKEQYQFIYRVVSLYAAKLTGGALDSI